MHWNGIMTISDLDHHGASIRTGGFTIISCTSTWADLGILVSILSNNKSIINALALRSPAGDHKTNQACSWALSLHRKPEEYPKYNLICISHGCSITSEDLLL
jgi:hypothetical protein